VLLARSGVSLAGSPEGRLGIRCSTESTTGTSFATRPPRWRLCFAIFANVLELDDNGEPINEKQAERRAALWLYQYTTGTIPDGERPLEPWECELN